MANKEEEKPKKSLRKEFFERFATLITGAFTFVAALAWNSAIQAFITRYISAGSGLISQFLYAIIITMIAILVIMQLNALANELDKEKK